MNWFKKIFSSKVQNITVTDSEVERAFQALLKTNGNVSEYFLLMGKKDKNVLARLYNLILIACGRDVILSADGKPSFAIFYQVAEEEIEFSKCPIYQKVLKYMETLNNDSIVILGILSCEMQSFNWMINELGSKQDTPLTVKQISEIEIYPPKLPC
ncbi:MAG: hypothetical protein ACSHW0_16170 [Thalassotalea sp.]